MKVELPGADIQRKIPFLVRKGQPDLDCLEQVDIAPHRLVMIIRRGLEQANWSGNDARKFSILLCVNARVFLATHSVRVKVRVGDVKCTIAT